MLTGSFVTSSDALVTSSLFLLVVHSFILVCRSQIRPVALFAVFTGAPARNIVSKHASSAHSFHMLRRMFSVTRVAIAIRSKDATRLEAIAKMPHAHS